MGTPSEEPFDDLVTAARMAKIAHQSYESTPDWSMIEDFRSAEWIDQKKAEAWVIDAGRLCVVAVPGTSSTRDALADLKFWSTRSRLPALGRARLHAGFEGQARRLVPAVVEVVNRLAEQRRGGFEEILTVGHSLGGPLAFLAAMELRRAGHSVARVWSFGCPRFARRRDASRLEQSMETYRFVNLDGNKPDIVTRIPQRSWGFRHVGAAILLTETSILSRFTSWADLLDRSRVSTFRAFKTLLKRHKQQIENHGSRTYLARLERLAESGR